MANEVAPSPLLYLKPRNLERVAQYMRENFTDRMPTRERLLDAMRPEDSPIHDCMVWDEKLLAHHMQLNICQGYIRFAYVKIEGVPVREYTPPLLIRETGEMRHVEINRVLECEDLTRQVLERALREADSWSLRYRRYKALADIHDSIQKTKFQLQTKEITND